jgi:methyl-accepting chemotaxis protein
MELLSRLSIRTRLALGYTALVLLVAVVALMAIRALGKSQQSFEHQVTEIGRIQEMANTVLDAANARAVAARNLVLSSDEGQAAVEVADIQKAHDTMKLTLNKLHDAVASLDGVSPKLGELLMRVEKTESSYGPVALEITRLGSTGKRDEAITKINKECRPLLAELIGGLHTLLTEVQRISTDNVSVSKTDFEALRLSMLGLGAVAALVAAVLGVQTTRSITRPLAVAMAASQSFSTGDLARPISVQGDDEIARMLAALETMRSNLCGIVEAVRESADGVATASVEIAQGNQDLSGRTETQASSLEETASSMEQLNATVKQNADNAQQANELANVASDVARQGGEVVSMVVDTMRGINESSRRIADIIGVIDGIAFQTNILALNAAVEAARAGEQGRGFAVVAGEVRNLAQRSAEAAKEIKSLINDSVERVGRGSELADKAGSTMHEIVEGIGRVTTIMREISSASSEQSNGVAQVSVAVTQMDRVTQQNAALVEEMAAAASSMSNRAKELVQSVAALKV